MLNRRNRHIRCLMGKHPTLAKALRRDAEPEPDRSCWVMVTTWADPKTYTLVSLLQGYTLVKAQFDQAIDDALSVVTVTNNDNKAIPAGTKILVSLLKPQLKPPLDEPFMVDGEVLGHAISEEERKHYGEMYRDHVALGG